jgi:hypothetical protein
MILLYNIIHYRSDILKLVTSLRRHVPCFIYY